MNGRTRKVRCWGCERGVPVVGERHEEPTDIPGVVYAYPCLRIPRRARRRDGMVIDVMLFCPRCLIQHIDAPEPDKGWENPPHKSHLCHACGAIWRPADVCTNGVAAAKTRGSRDTWPHLLGAIAAAGVDRK